MTEAPVAIEQAFKAAFAQKDVLIGGTTLTMDLAFSPAELGTWDAVGVARLVRGSTNPPLDLEFPMVGAMKFNPASEVLPKEYTVELHSEFPDGRVGIGLNVTMAGASFAPPSEVHNLEFTGQYTWLQGEPVTVSDAKFEMTNLSE